MLKKNFTLITGACYLVQSNVLWCSYELGNQCLIHFYLFFRFDFEDTPPPTRDIYLFSFFLCLNSYDGKNHLKNLIGKILTMFLRSDHVDLVHLMDLGV